MAEGMFIPQWQRKESEASLESDSWGFYCVLGATFNKLSWYSVKGCGLHQKPFSVTKSTRREKHTYTVPGAAERGATREVQAGGSSRLTRGLRGPAAQSSPLVVGGWQTDPPSADSSGTPRLHFSLPPTSEWQCPSQPRTFWAPTSTPKHWPKALHVLSNSDFICQMHTPWA